MIASYLGPHCFTYQVPTEGKTPQANSSALLKRLDNGQQLSKTNLISVFTCKQQMRQSIFQVHLTRNILMLNCCTQQRLVKHKSTNYRKLMIFTCNFCSIQQRCAGNHAGLKLKIQNKMLSLKLITDARKLSGLSLALMTMVSLDLVEQSGNVEACLIHRGIRFPAIFIPSMCI